MLIIDVYFVFFVIKLYCFFLLYKIERLFECYFRFINSFVVMNYNVDIFILVDCLFLVMLFMLRLK